MYGVLPLGAGYNKEVAALHSDHYTQVPLYRSYCVIINCIHAYTHTHTYSLYKYFH